MRILFLSNRPAKNSQASTVTEYLDALVSFSVNEVYEISMLNNFPRLIDLDRFDCVITHYSLSLGPMIQHYLGKRLIRKLCNYKGLKVAFLQDEYREIQTYWRNLNELGIHVLFSCVPVGEISKVYPASKVPNLRVVNVLTGYVSERLVATNVPSIADRPIDVGYRTRKPPYWLGRLGFEKWWIAQEFSARAQNLGLNIDFSDTEGQRLYGAKWDKFVSSCRSMIGVESGASIIDFDGRLERQVDEYCAEYPSATFDEVFVKFLTGYEGSLRLHQISPRCFEAAALRTPMILFEGDYSGILRPNRHYIPLKKDFSNFSEVAAKLNDSAALQELADRTYEEIALDPKYSYREFVKLVDNVLSAERKENKIKPAKLFYSKREFNWRVWLSLDYFVGRNVAMILQRLFLGLPAGRRFVFGCWNYLPIWLQETVRPLARVLSR